MAVSKIITIALLCLAAHRCTAVVENRVCTFWKGVYYPSPWRNIVFDRQTFQGSSKLLYALCNPSSYDRSCTLVRDRDEPFQGGNYTCNVGLKPTLRSGVLGEKFRVVPFGDDRAILAWLERSNVETRLGLTSVRFSDCSTHEVRVNVDHSFNDRLVLDNLQLLTYQYTYDALYTDSHRCGDKYCKLSVDVEAHRVSDPTPWFPIDRSSQIVDVKTLDRADQGALAIEANEHGSRFSILQGGAKKVLKVYGSSGTTSVASATSNDLIATCHLSGTTLSCAQYDQSGATINDSSNQLQGDLRLSAVHNLRGGAGLFVLLNDVSQNRVHVLRLDMRGKQVGTIGIDNFQCDQNMNAVAGNFWEKDEQYCVSLACYETDEASARKSDRGHLTATAKCFTLRDLKGVS